MKNYRFLVTGGAGYIGSHVVNLLLDNGHSVTVIDSLITGHKELVPNEAKLIICDIADQKMVSKIIQEGNFDLVMHFAGLISVEESVNEPERYNDFNVNKSKIFLNTCFLHGLNNVIFSSTASVYGSSNKNEVSERDKLNPLNPYALSKLKIEKFLQEKSLELPIKYVILRYFNVAGADQEMRTGLISKKSTHLIKIACEVALGKKDELIINGDDYDTIDGTPVRDYIHVSDLADIHLLCAEDLIKNQKSNIFNCGYGRGFSVNEVIKNLISILKLKITTRIGKRRPGDSQSVVADSSKFKKYFSWKPRFNDLENIIRSALEWEKKQKENI